jgi:hypothetical protein
MCPLFGNRRNEDGSAGKTDLSDCLILEPYRRPGAFFGQHVVRSAGFQIFRRRRIRVSVIKNFKRTSSKQWSTKFQESVFYNLQV